MITDKKGAWYEAKFPSPYRGLFPQTLEALGAMCGVYGLAAIASAQWAAASVHLMKGAKFSNPFAVVSVALRYCESDDRARLGYPDWQGRKLSSALYDLSQQSQCEAKLVGEETLADWRAAGSPYLSRHIRQTYQYIQSCIASGTADNIIKDKAE
jgi:hypothetical protein